MALKDYLVISRSNIQIAGLPNALLGGLFAGGNVLSPIFLIYVLSYFLAVTFACNLNAYFDVKVDSRYKTFLSNAVKRIGKTKMRLLLVTELLVLVAATVFFYASGFLISSALLFVGVLFAVVYSTPPLRLKARSFWSAWPLILGLFSLPLLGGWFLFEQTLTPLFVLFVLGYALLNEGINLINTSEDYSEDMKEGIQTWAHLFGLKNVLLLSWSFALVGGSLVLFSSYALKQSLLGVLVLAFFILKVVFELKLVSSAKDLESSAKEHAPKLSSWFIGTRYPLLLFLLFF